MAALGEEFRRAREARGLTLSDVAEQIHIRSVYLNAIENEEWTSIGAPVYVRGFIRTYARFLALDAESAVERFNQSAPAGERPAVHAVSAGTADHDRSGPSLWAIVGAIVAVVLVGFVGYEWWAYSQGAKAKGALVASSKAATPATAAPAPASGAPVPIEANVPSPSAAPVIPHRLMVRLTQRSWMRVTIDGAVQAEGIFPVGTVRTFSGNVADLRVGNAGGVLVSVDNRPPTLLGKDGDVVERRYSL
ncbi:MAG: DUF4115 domain-containing protein [Candidatus Elarobacter sp.]